MCFNRLGSRYTKCVPANSSKQVRSQVIHHKIKSVSHHTKETRQSKHDKTQQSFTIWFKSSSSGNCVVLRFETGLSFHQVNSWYSQQNRMIYPDHTFSQQSYPFRFDSSNLRAGARKSERRIGNLYVSNSASTRHETSAPSSPQDCKTTSDTYSCVCRIAPPAQEKSPPAQACPRLTSLPNA